MKRIHVLLLILAVLFMFYSSCSFALDPSWKADSLSSVSIRIPGLPGTGSARAIVADGGYMYIRTGGTAAGVSAVHGPYFVSPGTTFSTTEIPAGAYSFMAILYTAVNIIDEPITYEVTPPLAPLSVRELFYLDDASFLTYIMSDALNSIVDGRGSGKIIQNVNILPGTTNTVAVTLEPITGNEVYFSSGPQGGTSLSNMNATGSIGKFVRLPPNISYSPSTPISTTFTCSVTSSNGTLLPFITRVSLFDSLGNLIGTNVINQNAPYLTAALDSIFTVSNFTNTDYYFVYVEFSPGDLSLSVNEGFPW